ncbi:MAG TPA: hypothetical protein VMN82_09510 [Thermoanaerobaculia bacterium]|nr:hypothetical protein [Thermoanaerobaculia bacterium]
MTRGGRYGGVAGAVAGLAIPLLPKCPACVLPLVAAAGVALPHGPGVEAAVAAAVLGWLGFVFASARWWPVRLAAAAAVAALLAGRALPLTALAVSGNALMVGVGLWIALRPRRCHAAARAAPAP